MSDIDPAAPRSPSPPPATVPTKFCHACGAQIDYRAEICPRCGVRQPLTTGGGGKDRMLAAAFALLVGGLGIHKFYLGRVGLGVLYLLLSWTGIPSLVGWVEGIIYLRTSDEAWAMQYGGPVTRASGLATGCLWLVALLPLVAIFLVVALIVLGSQVSNVLNEVGNSI